MVSLMLVTAIRVGIFLKNTVFDQTFEAFGVKKSQTTTYHPEGDGMGEQFNRSFYNCCVPMWKNKRSGKNTSIVPVCCTCTLDSTGVNFCANVMQVIVMWHSHSAIGL